MIFCQFGYAVPNYLNSSTICSLYNFFLKKKLIFQSQDSLGPGQISDILTWYVPRGPLRSIGEALVILRPQLVKVILHFLSKISHPRTLCLLNPDSNVYISLNTFDHFYFFCNYVSSYLFCLV